jgi:hypothetical protein
VRGYVGHAPILVLVVDAGDRDEARRAALAAFSGLPTWPGRHASNRVRTFNGKLSGNLQFSVKRGARFTEFVDVAFDPVEACLFGGVPFAWHRRNYREFHSRCH